MYVIAVFPMNLTQFRMNMSCYNPFVNRILMRDYLDYPDQPHYPDQQGPVVPLRSLPTCSVTRSA